MDFAVELVGRKDFGPCDCCGNVSHTVWGSLSQKRKLVAAYYIRWVAGHADHAADFDLIIGRWGNGTSVKDRFLVAVAYRLIEGEPQFMVLDAPKRRAADMKELGATVLRRDQVIGTPLATDVFAMLDAIWLQDGRVRELAGSVA